MRFFFNEQVIQSRLTLTQNGREYFTTVTAVRYVTKPQVVNDRDAALYGGAVGQIFQIYCDASITIAEGDLLRDSQNRMYKVHTVSLVDDGIFPHKKLLLIMEKS